MRYRALAEVVVDVWEQSLLVTALVMAGCFFVAEVCRRLVPPLRSLGLPGSILAGMFGLLVGPQLLSILPINNAVLTTLVYHGLAIVFIAIALTPPDPGSSSHSATADATSMGFAIVVMISLQTVVGIAVVLSLGLLSEPTHPGFGLMLPLGFEQGPGQAMSMGKAWEASGGLVDGEQIGLVVAAAGFAWSIVVGVPLVAFGRLRGWTSSKRAAMTAPEPAVTSRGQPGSVDIMTQQLVIIGLCYSVTLGLCSGLYTLLMPIAEDVAPMVWGFHFIIGALVASAVRAALLKMGSGEVLSRALLPRISGTAVDITTVCAIAAVQLSVFASNWVPIAVLTTIGGVVTLVVCVWLAPRAFNEDRFEHMVVWFGMSTGTLPMGLALVRIIDPELRTSAAISAVAGSAVATLGAIPVVLLLHPAMVSTWPTAGGLWLLLLATVAYAVVVTVVWWRTGRLRVGQGGDWVT
ncbi:MAG: ESS family glutamate:Na+ symporter [Myxococcota bacterium]